MMSVLSIFCTNFMHEAYDECLLQKRKAVIMDGRKFKWQFVKFVSGFHTVTQINSQCFMIAHHHVITTPFVAI